MKKVPFKGHAKYLLREIEDGLKSTLSLSGARNLQEYKEKVKWYMISDGGKRESKF
jgi:IMP dehydrogenase/GMP reductase